jgi:hypothetical protein
MKYEHKNPQDPQFQEWVKQMMKRGFIFIFIPLDDGQQIVEYFNIN